MEWELRPSTDTRAAARETIPQGPPGLSLSEDDEVVPGDCLILLGDHEHIAHIEDFPER